MTEELLRKIDEAISEPIVGNYIFSDEEFYEICSFIKENCCYQVGNLCCLKEFISNKTHAKIVFVAIVNACRDLQTRPNDFYLYIGNHFNPVIYTSRSAVVHIVDRLSGERNVCSVGVGKRYYATICSHALAPLFSLKSLFDMCWNIYRKDMNYFYSEDDPIFMTAAEYLKSRFSYHDKNEESDVTVGGNIYSIRVGIKGLALSNPDILADFMREIIYAIDIRIDKNKLLENDRYWKKEFNAWFNEMIKDYGIEKIRKEKNDSDYVAQSYSSIRPRFFLNNGDLFIKIPSIRIPESITVSPQLRITSFGVEIYKESMCLRKESHLTSRTDKRMIKLSGSQVDINEIMVEIIHHGQRVYFSGTSLFRDFIVFSNGHEVSSKYSLPGEYIMYCKNPGSLIRRPEIIKAGKFTYYFEAIDGDALQSRNQKIEFFNETTNKSLHFYAKKYNDVFFEKDGQKYDVIDCDLCVDIDVNKTYEDVGVLYDDEHFLLKDFESQSEVIGDIKRFHISWLKNDGEPQKITIFSYDKKHYNYLSEIRFIKLTDIEVKFEKQVYYNCEKIAFDFNTANLQKRLVSKVAKRIAHSFNGGKLVFLPPVLLWNIDDGDVCCKPKIDTVWYEDFVNNSSILYVNDHFANICELMIDDFSVKRTSDGRGFLLGQTLFSKMDKVLRTVSIKIGEMSFKVADVCLKEGFVSDPIEIDSTNKKIQWFPERFCGRRPFKMELVLFNKYDPDSKGTLSLNQEPVIYNCKEHFSNGEYKYHINLIDESNPFLSDRIRLHSGNFIFGEDDTEKLVNCKIVCVSYKIIKEQWERNLSSSFFIEIKAHIRDKYYLGTVNMRNNNVGFKFKQVIVQLIQRRTCFIFADSNISSFSEYHKRGFYVDKYDRLALYDKSKPDNKQIEYFRFEVSK